MKTIVLDAGHGGYDYGAVNGSRYEKNDNLRLALAVRDKLAGQSGQRVIMTRTSDVFVPLLERSYISNANNADIFVSLHRNASTNPAANGVENYVKPAAPAINTAYAQNVLNEVVNVGVQSNRGVKQEDFSVLRNTNAPAQLLEMGFITNETDNIMFDRFLDDYATAITKGILKSLNIPYVAPGTDRSNIIRSIQSTLNSRYNAGLVVDGIFGPNTKRALVRGLQYELNRQYNAGLVVDGIFGANTRAAIRSVRRPASGNIVYLLQAMLFLSGYNSVIPDGAFGKLTEEAVMNFQSSRNLTVDGIAGPATLAALFG